MNRTITPQEVRQEFDDFEKANAFWNIQMESIRGYKLRVAHLDYEENFDTKIGRWYVYIRWYEIPKDTPIATETLYLTEMVNNGT